MKRAACLLLALCALAITVLIGVYGYYASPKRIVSEAAGFDLPLGSMPIRQEQRWRFNTGHSVWVYQMPAGSRARLLGDCRRLDYDVNTRTQLFVAPEAEITPDNCFKLIEYGTGIKLTVVTSDDRLIVYVDG